MSQWFQNETTIDEFIGSFSAAISTVHLLIWSGAFALTFLIFRLASQITLRRLKARYRALPGARIPISPEDLPLGMYRYITRQAARAISPASRMLPDPRRPPADTGWGREPNGELLHFKSAIVMSLLALEDAAAAAREELARLPQQTVREYVHSLRDRCPALPSHVCEEYIQMYERARFGPGEFTVHEFERFRSVEVELLQSIS